MSNIPTRKMTYTIEVVAYPDGKVDFKRRNEGFDSLTLLGALKLSYDEVLEQVQGNFKPQSIERITHSKTTMP